MAPPSVRSRHSPLTILGRDVGVLLMLLDVLFLLPLAVALLYGETYTAMSFLVGSGLSAAVGTFLILPDYGVAATLFDAVTHAMTGQSTGGFSTLDDSIAGYGSYAMELLHIPAMLLGAIALPVYYGLLQKRSLRPLWEDVQARTM